MKPIALLLSAVLLGGAAACAAADDEPRKYTRNVAIVVYESAEPLDWTGPFEVYNDAARMGGAHGQDAFNVYVVSKTTAPVDSQGLKVVPSYSIEDAPRPDIVLFPGGPETNITADPAFFAWAKQAAEKAEIAQSVCTGAFVLARAGLLDGKDATTHYGSIDRLRTGFPKATVVNGRRYVDDGHVVSTAGISAGIDGSLHVVARLLGRRVADQVASYMEYRWTPEPYLAGQYSYLNPSTDASGRQMQQAEMLYEGKSYAEAAGAYRTLLAATPDDRDLWNGLAFALADGGDHAAAAEAFLRSVEGRTGGRAGYFLFRAAREYARAGRKEQAATTLQRAFASGYADRESVDKDPAFASLR